MEDLHGGNVTRPGASDQILYADKKGRSLIPVPKRTMTKRFLRINHE
jgi:hypothetical protein